jgi:aminopeptidase-like protein
MNYNFNIDNFVSKNQLKLYFKKLFPICRSIMGNGFRDSLNIIGEIVDLNLIKFKSGSNVLDWTIPNEWNIKDAYVLCPNGNKIIDFKKNNLHVVNYSIPINKTINLDQLKKNLHTLPKQPNAIPYVTSYYNPNWGFCLEYNKYKKLKSGNYKVFIDSSIKKGELIISDKKIVGKSKKEILLSTYLCHPQMANHELSGPLVWAMLYRILKETGPHKYTYRFLICPETIGSAAFLHKNKKNIHNIIAGYVINCVGHGKEINYKKSRIGNSLADKAAINVIKHSKKKYFIHDFFPWGSDEKQFCTPGFNMPIGLLMRKRFGGFKEYHTSLDNEKLISYDTLIESIKLYYEILLTIENNYTPQAKIIYGAPQLSKSKDPLYPNLMKWKITSFDKITQVMLEILNICDGNIDFLDAANSKNFKLIDYLDLIKKLEKNNYIKKIS